MVPVWVAAALIALAGVGMGGMISTTWAVVGRLAERMDRLEDRMTGLADRMDGLADRMDRLGDRMAGVEVSLARYLQDGH